MNRRAFALGLSLAVGGAGAYFGFMGSVQDTPPLLSILSPPGAGYDSTNVALGTGSGVALTFLRASAETCEITPGALTSVVANKPCVESGALKVEPSGTNLALQSEALDDVTWDKNNVASTAPTVTANAATAPDGNATADRIAYPAVGAAASSYVSQSIAASAVAYTGSVYLKATSGTPTVYVYFVTGGPTYAGSATACTLNTSTWTRCVVANKTLTAATWFFRIGIDTRDASQATQGGGTVYAWGCQLETGSVATSYIPTAGATASRAAQTTTVPKPAGLSTTEGSLCLNITPAWTGTQPNTGAGNHVFWVSGNAGNTSRLAYTQGNQNNYAAGDGTNFPTVAAGFTAATRKRYCTRWSTTRNSLRVENVTAGTSGSTAFAGFPSLDATVSFMPTTGSGAPANIDSLVLSASYDGAR